MVDGMTVRPAAPADVPSLASVINDAFRVERFFVDGDRITPEEIVRLMNEGTFLIAEDASGVIGCVFVDVARTPAYLGLLTVASTHQGRGFGHLLMERAEQWCASQGADAIQIRVVNLREELPPFYHRLGYRDIGTEPFSAPSHRPCHFIVMSKELERRV